MFIFLGGLVVFKWVDAAYFISLKVLSLLEKQS
jgi:hypothetical protein